MKSSGWQWNSRKRDADAAKWAGFKTLSEFEELPKDDKLDVIALYEINWRIEAINNWEQAEEIKRSSNKPKRRK